jgi:hypothetical protein
MKRNLLAIALAIAVMSLAPIATLAQQPMGAFSIDNNTGVTLYYQVRWGDGPWVDWTLMNGWINRHWHPLDSRGEAPTPQVRYDVIGGDGGFTEQIYDMEFYSVWNTSSGGLVNVRWDVTPPKAYYFRFSPDGRFIQLYRR